VPRESKTVLDLTKQDFQNILNVTGRIFEIEVHRSEGCLSTVLCPNSEFLKQDLKGKHSWLNASSAIDLAEIFRHVLSACVLDPLSTSVYSHQAVNAYRYVFAQRFPLYLDCAQRRSCPSVARGRFMTCCAKP
jgi:hypothetical protein